MMVAVGSLAATEVRAEANAAGSGATSTPGQQDDAKPQSKESTVTVNADGTVSREPNPMSVFLKTNRQFGALPMVLSWFDDHREDVSGGSGQTN